MSPRNLARLWQIWRVYRRYGLAEFIGKPAGSHDRPRGERLRLALEELGPVFVKFGQALSTRPDILPADVATELARLQDQVPPFPGEQAREAVEAALGKPVEELFAAFDETPLASASIAQVHAARLKPEAAADDAPTPDGGFEVVVKVLRPGVHERVERDVELLHALAAFAHRHVNEAHRLRPMDVVREYEKIIRDGLDLGREAANAAQLRRNWLGSEVIYHPIVFFSHTRRDVLVMERIHGITVDETDRLRELGVDFQVLSERGVEIFFKQVFRDNFFHADMHPGNIFVDPSDPAKPRYLAVDFGIVGTLSPSDQRFLAEKFLAFFNRDYRRVAELFLESQWVPASTRVDEFEAAIRTVCEPIFNRPLKDISFGLFLLRLFETARRFDMQVQPQLVLLQKTLLNIEGLGRQLYPELDLWKTAKPIMEEWMRARLGPGAAIERLRRNIPTLTETLPELAHRLVARMERGEDPFGGERQARAIEELRAERREQSRRQRGTVMGAALIVGALVVFGLDGYRPAMLYGVPLLTWLFGAAGALLWFRALRKE